MSKSSTTRDEAAAHVGLGSGKTYERGRETLEKVEKTAPELLDKLCAGEMDLKRAARVVRDHDAAAKRAMIVETPSKLRRELHQCRAEELASLVEHGTVDVIITDPPYPKAYLDCWTELAYAASKLLKPGGLVVAMSGQTWLPQVIARLGERLDYHWTGAYITSGSATVIHPRRLQTMWKPLLIYSNGQYDGERFSDLVNAAEARDRVRHEWQQSEAGVAEIVARFSRPGDIVCDPFLGGGSTARAALTQNRHFIGCDIELQEDLKALQEGETQ